MPRHTHDEYLASIAALQGPVLHTVGFESVHGPGHDIGQHDQLLAAIDGLRNVTGVGPRIIAATALDRPGKNIVEEISLSDPDALQRLRNDKEHHSAVTDIAAKEANWLVVDRPLPANYADEPAAIARAKAKRLAPALRHDIIGLDPDMSPAESDEATGKLAALGAEMSNAALPGLSTEFAAGADKRKGDVFILRTPTPDAKDAFSIQESGLYTKTMRDLGSTVAKHFVIVHHV